jgi:hypothetical protein
VKPICCFLALALLLAIRASGAVSDPSGPLHDGNHHDFPVYYELNREPLLPHEKNLTALHADTLYLRHYPGVDVSGFNWSRGGINDFSWWIQVEELRFLLPFIRSARPEDRLLAARWFLSWYESQRHNPFVNDARWGEPMSAAYRGLVLVYYLKVEESRSGPDAALARKLRETIRDHQEFLQEEQNFNDNSNHGLVESLGLLEVTRVFPDSELEETGLQRMLRIVGRSVSESGIHMEHSPVYHFVFLNWLDKFAGYLDGLPYLQSDLVARLSSYREAMQKAAWYLADHDGTIAQLGDSDSVQVESRYPHLAPAADRGRKTVLFDREAGYAIYKGNRSRGDRRYVVFANQNRRPALIYHYHDDVLSVYYAYDGEVILGDGGKYEYSATADRRFFVSPAAHNTVFPLQYLTTRRVKNALFLADRAGAETGRAGTTFFARVVHSSGNVTRAVFVPRHGGSVEIEDRIVWPPGRNERERTARAGRKPLFSVQVWNLGPDVEYVTPVETGDTTCYEWVVTSRRGREFRVRIQVRGGTPARGCAVELVRGSRDPVVGWYSPAMFVKRPAYAIVATLRSDGEQTVITKLDPVGKKPFMLRIGTRGF